MVENLADKLFWSVHRDLPREGPGDDASTLRAYSMLTDLPARPRILDIGCGPGAQTVALAKASQAHITAVDTHQPFLDDLAWRAALAGVADRIQSVNMTMFELDFDWEFDLLWSEGAIYIIGFAEGLQAWRSLLKPGGYMAVTEVSWLQPEIPAKPARFWAEAYPKMGSLDDNLARINQAGYHTIGHFTLPESAWWENYYHPMAKRIDQLRQQYKDHAEAQCILGLEYAEIELYRHHSRYYGYVFYIMQAI